MDLLCAGTSLRVYGPLKNNKGSLLRHHSFQWSEYYLECRGEGGKGEVHNLGAHHLARVRRRDPVIPLRTMMTKDSCCADMTVVFDLLVAVR